MKRSRIVVEKFLQRSNSGQIEDTGQDNVMNCLDQVLFCNHDGKYLNELNYKGGKHSDG